MDCLVELSLSQFREEDPIDTLVGEVEDQQRWLYLLLQRSSLLATSYEEMAKKIDDKSDVELSKLEASVELSGRMIHEIGEKIPYIVADALKKVEIAEMTSKSALEELSEVHSERVLIEVEAMQQVRSLERSFETVVQEKCDELAELRTQLMTSLEEVERLRMDLMNAEAVNKGIRAKSEQVDRNLNSDSGLLLPALEALWQVSSDKQQADLIKTGSPTLLTSLNKQLKALFPQHLTAPFSSSQAPRLPDSSSLALIPAIYGILVNISATTEGRRWIVDTNKQDLLVLLVDSIEHLYHWNSSHDHHFSEETRKDLFSSLELVLCVVSNLCYERTVAIKVIEAGVIDRLRHLIQSPFPDEVRRYAISILTSNLQHFPLARNIRNLEAKDPSSSIPPILSLETFTRQIGDTITYLSKEPQLKKLGLELLEALHRIMPTED